MDAKLTKIYYSPGGYWKGIAAIKKLSEAAKVPGVFLTNFKVFGHVMYNNMINY